MPRKSEITLASMGQFCNDLGYSPQMLKESPAEGNASYERASDKHNSLFLAWQLAAEDCVSGTLLVPQQVCSVTRCDVRLTGGVSVELGCRYGLDFWRARDESISHRALCAIQ